MLIHVLNCADIYTHIHLYSPLKMYLHMLVNLCCNILAKPRQDIDHEIKIPVKHVYVVLCMYTCLNPVSIPIHSVVTSLTKKTSSPSSSRV